jgi:hypothetical protein
MVLRLYLYQYLCEARDPIFTQIELPQVAHFIHRVGIPGKLNALGALHRVSILSQQPAADLAGGMTPLLGCHLDFPPQRERGRLRVILI